MVKSLRFHWILYKAALKSRTEYRVDFAVGVFTAAITQLAALSFYWLVFEHVPSLAGWSHEAVLFLFGMTALSFGLAELFLNGVWAVPGYVITGEFDRLLVYPVRSLPFLLIARPELHALGNLVTGAVLVGVAFHALAVSAWVWCLVPVWAISGALIYTAALVLMGCTCLVVSGPLVQPYWFMLHLLNASRYPVSIYPEWLQRLLLLVLPVSVPMFIPGRWLVGAGSWLTAVLAPPLAAVACTIVAAALWQLSLRRYQSTGS